MGCMSSTMISISSTVQVKKLFSGKPSEVFRNSKYYTKYSTKVANSHGTEKWAMQYFNTATVSDSTPKCV